MSSAAAGRIEDVQHEPIERDTMIAPSPALGWEKHLLPVLRVNGLRPSDRRLPCVRRTT